MCFLPNSRASIDQAPGPTIARVAPRVANMMGIQGSPGREKAIHTSAMASKAPVTGVHNPTRRSTPAPAAMIGGAMDAN